MSQEQETERVSEPRTADETEKRGGLEPEEFQRELVVVTATVLILGIVGGSCLGMKIQRAEKLQKQRAAQQSDSSPSDRNPSETPGGQR